MPNNESPITNNGAMSPESRVYIAGHRGLVGSAIVRRLLAGGHSPESLVLRTHSELDLTNQAAVDAFFEEEKPEYVFLAAAKVGGIVANNSYPAEFIGHNLAIQTNVIDGAYRNGVKRLLFLGSSCIYPRDCPQPIKEEYLLTGPLEPTNRPYALAKIAGIEMCWAYNRQYGTQYMAVMPTNLYGPGDNYDLEKSHVIPALIRKCHLAKLAMQKDWDGISADEARYGAIPNDLKEALGIPPHTSHLTPHVPIWGTGTPRREFLYSDDMAEACVYLMNLEGPEFDSLVTDRESPPLVNIGCGEDITIRELAETVADVVEFEGDLEFDTSKPDGTPQKLLDVARLGKLGWRRRTSFRVGLEAAYHSFASADR